MDGQTAEPLMKLVSTLNPTQVNYCPKTRHLPSRTKQEKTVGKIATTITHIEFREKHRSLYLHVTSREWALIS